MKPQEFTIPQQYIVGEIKINSKAQLGRTYLRLLLDAFVPHLEAMLAYLDELLMRHDPQLVQRQLKEVEKQDRKKSKEWEQTLFLLQQTDQSEHEKIMARLQDIQDEENALFQTNMDLIKQLRVEARSQAILQHKREDILKLLQSRQAMIEEGTWERLSGKDNMSHVFSLLELCTKGLNYDKLAG